MRPRGSGFFRDNPKLSCMGHPDCRRPCRHEPDRLILKAARAAARRGRLSAEDLRCIELDSSGFPGRMIVGYAGGDPTGKHAHRARYACERAYAKIGRRLCRVCRMLWAMGTPKGPRLEAGELKWPVESFPEVRRGQERGSVRLKRRRAVPLLEHDRRNYRVPITR